MNTDGKMSYKNFVFPVNPSLIRIESGRRLYQKECTEGVTEINDGGKKLCIITGEGEFFGENCTEHYQQLKNTMGGGGILYIPSQKPVYAYFEKLELICSDIEGVIKYKFRFVESVEKELEKQIHTIYGDGKKCLWDYSYITGIGIDILVRLNPHIKRPDIPVNGNERIKLC